MVPEPFKATGFDNGGTRSVTKNESMRAYESAQSRFAHSRVSAELTGMKYPLPALLFVPASLLVTATGCSNKTNVAAAPTTPEVEVVQVQQRDVPIYGDWIGTLDGLVNADIKAQVSGYLLEQAYKEGTFVKKGQLLFQIDPRPFQAALDQARGSTGAGAGAAGAGPRPTAAGRSSGRGGGSQSAPHATRRRPLHPARAATGHHPAGSG